MNELIDVVAKYVAKITQRLYFDVVVEFCWGDSTHFMSKTIHDLLILH